MSVSSATYPGTSIDLSAPLAFAKAAQQKRALNNLDVAISKGKLSDAAKYLQNTVSSFKTSFGTTSSLDTATQTALNNDFKTLATAIGKNDTKATTTAWTTTKAHLSGAGITVLNNSALLSAQAMATSASNTSAALANALFGSNESSSTNNSSSNWMTYSLTGSTSSIIGSATGTILNAFA